MCTFLPGQLPLPEELRSVVANTKGEEIPGNQFSSYPGDSLWLFTGTWANTQDPGAAPLHSLWHTAISRAGVLNKSLS